MSNGRKTTAAGAPRATQSRNVRPLSAIKPGTHEKPLLKCNMCTCYAGAQWCLTELRRVRTISAVLWAAGGSAEEGGR